MTTNIDLVKDIAEKVFPKSVFFEGVIHPSGKENSYNGLFMREKDIQEWRSKIKDTPLWFNHNERKKIGKVLAGYMDSKKQLRVMAIIDTSTIDGILIAEEVRAGKLNSLSMGKYAIADQGKGEQQVIGHDIFEVSIVENPDLEGTSIDYIQPHNESQKKSMEYQKERLALVNEDKTATALPESVLPGFFSFFFNAEEENREKKIKHPIFRRFFFDTQPFKKN
jgi:phage head maturation protease